MINLKRILTFFSKVNHFVQKYYKSARKDGTFLDLFVVLLLHIFSDFEGQFPIFFFQKRDFINDSVSGSGGNFERVQ